jgi:hypothetical protein
MKRTAQVTFAVKQHALQRGRFHHHPLPFVCSLCGVTAGAMKRWTRGWYHSVFSGCSSKRGRVVALCPKCKARIGRVLFERKGLTVEKDLMSEVQQAELQGKVWELLAEFRTRHGLSERSIWFWGVAFFWGYARRLGASNEVITQSTVRAYNANELALQKAGGMPLDASKPSVKLQ